MELSWQRLGASVLGVALTLSTAACAAIRSPLTPPERGGAPWRELRSTHFVVETDEDSASARELLLEAERSHAALSYVLKRPRVESEVPVELVVFARKLDFAELTDQRNVIGYFQSALPLDTEPSPVIVLQSSELPSEKRRLWQHELAHRILHERFPTLPRWLDEGSAEFYSSLRVEDGKIHLGAPTDFDFSERPFFWLSRLEDDAEQREVPVHLAPTLVELVTASPSDFYGDIANDRGKPRERTSAFYAASWKLVHLLSNGAGAQARASFEAFQADLERGQNANDTFFKRFGAGGSSLAEAYSAYLRRDSVPRTVLAAPAEAEPAAIQERVLTPAEVHLLWARLSEAPYGVKARARSELATATALDPRSLHVLLCKAKASVLDDDLVTAKQTLDGVMASHPDDPRALNALVDWYRRQATKQGPASFEAAPADVVDRLAKNAVSASQLENAARYRLVAKRTDEGLALAQRSIRRDPLCASCEDAYALALGMVGRLDEADVAIDRAIVLTGEHGSLGPLLAHREAIRRARAR